jgi:Trypsin-like peptidase domain
MAEIKDETLEAITRGLTLSRKVFEDRYDQVALEMNTPVFKKIAFDRSRADAGGTTEVGRDAADYLAALKVARDAKWVERFVIENFNDLKANVSDPILPQLQSIVNFNQKFAFANEVTSGTIAASRRCCQILIRENKREKAAGSGFLIGPNLVLTNYHVIASLLTPDGKIDTTRDAGVICAFDHYANAQEAGFKPVKLLSKEQWLVASSPSRPNTAQAGELEDALDYAVIRIEQMPGYVRGWYDLASLPPIPPVGAGLEVWQFPDGEVMQVSLGKRANPPDDLGFDPAAPLPPRLFHDANTVEGSSGSLVVDAGKTPVALHDAGFGDKDKGLPNRCIPLQRVFSHCQTALTQAIREAPEKIGWHPDGKRPILGRAKLLTMLEEAVRGDVRVIAILTPPDPATRERVPRIGRSFTEVMLEARLPPQEHQILEFSASLIDPDPFVTAQRLVKSLAKDEAASLVPSRETTLDADATVMLVEKTTDLLLNAAPGKTVWVMIDNLDTHPIATQWPSSTFLIALYRRAAAEARLRFVLVGLQRHLEGLNDMLQARTLDFEPLETAPNDNDLRDWVEANLARATWQREMAENVTRMVRSVARADPDIDKIHLTEATARVLERHAKPAFRMSEP